MAFLDPVKNIYGMLAKASEEAGSLLGIADSRGMTGVLRNLMGLDPEGMKKVIDETLGTGILDSLASGDETPVQTVLEFRQYCMDLLGEFVKVRDILMKFNSEVPEVRRESVSEMKALASPRGQAVGGPRRVQALDAEVKKLKAKLADIAALASQD